MLLDHFSKTLESVYAAAAEPALWSNALKSIEDLTGSAGAVLGFEPKAGGTGFVLSGRFTQEQCLTYAQEYAPTCRRLAMAKARPDIRYGYDDLVASDEELDRDPVYNWLERVNGVRYYLGSRLPDVGDYHVNTSIQRTRAQGHVQQADLDLYARLVPHLGQALTLSNAIGTLTSQHQVGLQLLQSMPHGILVLDAAQRLLFANAAAEATFAANDGLTVVRGRLVSARGETTQRLNRLLTLASAGQSGGWLRLEKSSCRRPYSVFVAPCVTENIQLTSVRPAVMVALFDPDRQSSLKIDTLQALYDLSPKESEVALLISEGVDAAAAAAQLGISYETIRAHLKSIFRKMEVGRQQDLVSLLASLSSTPTGYGA